MPSPSTSIVVCTARRPAQLGRCLAALARQSIAPDEIVVVDNAPDASTALAVAATVAATDRARLVPEPIPGLGRARNAGARAARGDLLLFVDDDGEPAPDWVERTRAEFDDTAVVAVAGRIVALDDGGPRSAERARAAGFPIGGDAPFTIDRQTPDWAERLAFGGVVNGANIAVRREAFERWAGFDPLLGSGAAIPGGEESLAFLQLARLGGRIVYAPGSVVRHPYPADGAALAARALRGDSCAVAYLLLLITRERGLRLRLLAHAVRRACGVRPAWAAATVAAAPPAPRWRRWWARLAGLPLFVRAIARRGS